MPLVRLPDFKQISSFIRHFFISSAGGHGVHSPFAYRLCEEVFYNNNFFYEFEHLETRRAELQKNNTTLNVEDLGAGSKLLPNTTRKVSSIAKNGISNKVQSQILFRLINYFDYKTTIELGTSLGLNTLYLARANKNGKVFSLEGSKNLIAFASEQARKINTHNIEFIAGNFDQRLPELLNTIQTFDLAYVDGNHHREATLRYFHYLLEKVNEQSCIVFDDIHWSHEMSIAWEEIKQHPSVRLSIDTYSSGYVFFRSELKEKQHLHFWL
ncbi:MAG: class I SAM-dependent methyltransferase [Bacteroidia bacterium]|jgi:predicted O-methyltransferase YrrM|nr:class I SAM-dependent methyltransferase [Bacteroidia bacterium]